MLKQWWEEFKIKYRKHDFDIANPEIVLMKGVSRDFLVSYYTCKRCGIQYGLDFHQIIDLPNAMARGCKGRITKNEGNDLR